MRTAPRERHDLWSRARTAALLVLVAAVVVLILGGIGVSSVTRVFVQQKVKSIAVLKCLGASSWTVLAVVCFGAYVLAKLHRQAMQRATVVLPNGQPLEPA